jgi:hypothetical protein
MEHGYHRLRKEQSLMIDHMLLNLYNPVKFSLSHILKQYKRAVTCEADAPTAERYVSDQDNLTPVLERIVKREIAEAPSSQAGVLDRINSRLIAEMPGIQYEAIGKHISMQEVKKGTKISPPRDPTKRSGTQVAPNGSLDFNFCYPQRLQSE